jgi:hypothetical protein
MAASKDGVSGSYRSHPYLWRRHASRRHVVIRPSDVTDDVAEVSFATADQCERFLSLQKIERKLLLRALHVLATQGQRPAKRSAR